jgi:hypothetical protein
MNNLPTTNIKKIHCPAQIHPSCMCCHKKYPKTTGNYLESFFLKSDACFVTYAIDYYKNTPTGRKSGKAEKKKWGKNLGMRGLTLSFLCVWGGTAFRFPLRTG